MQYQCDHYTKIRKKIQGRIHRDCPTFAAKTKKTYTDCDKKKVLSTDCTSYKKKRWWPFDSDQTVEKAPFHSLPSDTQQQNYLFCCFQSSCYPVLSLSLSIEICSSTIDQCLSSDGSVWAEVDTHPVLVLPFSSILSSSTSSIEQPVAASFDALAIAQLMTPRYEL